MQRARPVRAVAAWSWFGLLAAFVLAVNLLALRGDEAFARALAPEHVGDMALGLAYALLGALLVFRRPSNPIGLLMLLTATAYAIPPDPLLVLLSKQTWVAEPVLTLLVGASTTWVLLYTQPIMFLLLLFPTGRPPGPRWRLVAHANFAFVALTLVYTAIYPAWRTMDGQLRFSNPLYLRAGDWTGRLTERMDTYLTPVYIAILFGLLVLNAAAPFVRYRRAGAIERAQIRWLLYAAALYVAAFILADTTDSFTDTTPYSWLFALALLAIPVAVAIAILRHRLFDIDVIIRRTLQYGLLTGLLTGLYFGSVLLVRTLLGPLAAGADSPPVVMVTTLALAALFNPLRVRVQRFIDRRFYRRRVDGERAVERFAALARDEVDLDELRAALFGTVERTWQPERMGLWLRPQRNVQRGAADATSDHPPP